MGVAQGATVHIANTSFNGNIGTPTISNGGKIVWTCQLGYYKQQSGDYGTGRRVNGIIGACKHPSI